MKAIKVGNYRFVLDNISHVVDVGKDSAQAIVVVMASEIHQSQEQIVLRGQEAREFLALFDNAMETGTVTVED